MTWPPQLPDLKAIEMVWDELDRRVKEKQHMWELLQDCWKGFQVKLVERMQWVANKGWLTVFLVTT
jgi:hypothetical protein